ncbi:MAG: hypothetical protein ABEI76_06490 [Halobacteriales archaeon]
MATASEDSLDRRIGYTVIFSLLALGGAFMMYLFPGNSLSAWGFGLAMVAASLAVMAEQVY